LGKLFAVIDQVVPHVYRCFPPNGYRAGRRRFINMGYAVAASHQWWDPRKVEEAQEELNLERVHGPCPCSLASSHVTLDEH